MPDSKSELLFWLLPVGALIYAGIFAALNSIAAKSSNNSSMTKVIPMNNVGMARRHVLLYFTYFLPIALVGIFYLLVFYPGTCMNDTIYIFMYGIDMASQHPWFYCYLIITIANLIFDMGGTFETVLFVLALIQILLASAVYAASLLWLRLRGLSKTKTLILWIVYAFLPILDIYLVTVVKDVPFSILLICWVPLLYDLWKSDGALLKNKSYVLICSLYIFLSLIRNNGLYVSAFILFCLFLFYLKRYLKSLLVLLLVLVATISFSHYIEKSWGITHEFKETIGIPLQQVAAVVADEGNLTTDEKDFISNIMPIDAIKSQYNPYYADQLKWSEIHVNSSFLNKNRGAFLSTWFQIGIKNIPR